MTIIRILLIQLRQCRSEPYKHDNQQQQPVTQNSNDNYGLWCHAEQQRTTRFSTGG